MTGPSHTDERFDTSNPLIPAVLAVVELGRLAEATFGVLDEHPSNGAGAPVHELDLAVLGLIALGRRLDALGHEQSAPPADAASVPMVDLLR